MPKEGKRRKAVLIAVVFFILLIIMKGLVMQEKKAKDSSNQDEKEEVFDFAVTVQTKEYSGQGVAYASSGHTTYILTAAHLTQGIAIGEHCTVTLGNGEETEAMLVYRSEIADAAFFVLDKKEGLLPIPMDRTRFDRLRTGDAVRACYIADGILEQTPGEILYPWIYLEDFALDMMLVKMEAKAGMSGCAVLDEEGYFVGIVCGVNEAGEAAVLPLSVIESEWLMTGRERDS